MSSTPLDEDILQEEFSLEWFEYVVFSGVLAASLAIGVYHGFFNPKNQTNQEFLTAGRSMSILPVTMSLICSFVSAITLLGNPVEIYFYGAQYTMIAVAFVPMTFILSYFYVPTYYGLQLTSAYEYFELRFSSKVRLVLSTFAIIHLIFYLPITCFGPSLALDQVAGIDYRISAAAIFLVCVAYSSMGGLRAVLWTDALQALVMVTSLLAVIIIGVYEVGGISLIWQRAEGTRRTELFNFDLDPRSRHTFWTSTVGGCLMWLPLFAATQAQIQRYNSVPTLRASKMCLLFNMVGMIVVILLCSIIGLMIYAQYWDCDPEKAGKISSADQLLPFFVMDVLREYKSLPGLLVAGLTCGSLSTVSSGLNSLTAILMEDFITRFVPHLNDSKVSTVSKLVSATVGMISFGLIFIVAFVNESINISPFSTLMHGSLLGPILGAFTLGIFLPWANDQGVQLGVAFSIFVTGFFGLGNLIANTQGKLPDQKLFLTTEGCERTNVSVYSAEVSSFLQPDLDSWKNSDDSSFLLKLCSLSYIWQPAIGFISTIIFSLVFIKVVNWKKEPLEKQRVHKSLLNNWMINFWLKIYGQYEMEKWIDFDSKKEPIFSANNFVISNRQIKTQL